MELPHPIRSGTENELVILIYFWIDSPVFGYKEYISKQYSTTDSYGIFVAPNSSFP